MVGRKPQYEQFGHCEECNSRWRVKLFLYRGKWICAKCLNPELPLLIEDEIRNQSVRNNERR